MLNNYICIKKFDANEILLQEDFYTNDGFNYLSIAHDNKIKTVTLIDRADDLRIEFDEIE